MNAGLWIAIFFPIFILLFIIQPQQRRIALNSIRRKREGIIMTNEIVKKYIGKNCMVSTGSFGGAISGEITEVTDNWVELSTKIGYRLVNAEFITTITENLPKKRK